jgi:hypothetical protein
MDSIEVYRMQKIEQAERRAAAFATEQVLYADDGTDGGQAIIDLALTGGYRLCGLVCDKLAAAGYYVPAGVKAPPINDEECEALEWADYLDDAKTRRRPN